jgi:hypothetical protein
MDTADRVWHFMLDHQDDKGRPPTMAEIQTGVPGLNHRSSVAYALDTLVGEGRVVETGDPGTACRHRAIPVEGTTTIIPPIELPDTHIVPALSVEDMDR